MIRNKIIAMLVCFTFIIGILGSCSMVAYAKAWDSSDTSAAIGILGKIIDGSRKKKEKNQQSNDKTIKQIPQRKKLTFNEKMLMEAIRNNDGKTLVEMINAGVDINTYYEDGYYTTPLGLAIKHKKRDMQQILLSNGADVTGYVLGKRKFSYLCDAAKNADLELFKYLHNWGADINETHITVSINDRRSTRIDNSLTCLLYLSGTYEASSGIFAPNVADIGEYLLEMVSYMIDEGIDPNFIQKDYIFQRYDSALTLAAGLRAISTNEAINIKARRAVVKRLLEAGADANFKNSKGLNAADIMIDSSYHRADIEGAKMIQSYMR